ncbi:MAG TPA: PilN domain-containing protein [Rhodopseudomonas sp.]|uniref:PilN domain-containing protein n=1 Tax=Rhodopseudomonas sp. TaxID=1078 RepID=UPI002ED87418
MLNAAKAKTAWWWFIDGLAESTVSILDRLTRRRNFRVDASGDRRIVDGSGVSLGRLIGTDTTLHLQPPEIAAALADSAVDVELPPRWLWRRTLPPVAADSLPYLDAFVLHQIERISPWRQPDVYYSVARTPVENDPSRFAIEVGIVPKKLVDATVGVLAPLCGRLRLVARGAGDIDEVVIAIGSTQTTRQRRIRRPIVAAVAGIGIVVAGWIALTAWQLDGVGAELADLDRQITAGKAALAAQRGGAATGFGEALLVKRVSQPYVVELVDALSQALPDHAHLLVLRFEKDLIRISGISQRTAELIPALERSNRFADVKFSAATTRLEDGNGDRFHLEMRPIATAPGSKP